MGFITIALIIIGVYILLIPFFGVMLKVIDERVRTEHDQEITDEELIKWSCCWIFIIPIILLCLIADILNRRVKIKEKYLQFINYFVARDKARRIRREARELRGISKSMKQND